MERTAHNITDISWIPPIFVVRGATAEASGQWMAVVGKGELHV
jgi:hypothetical protein